MAAASDFKFLLDKVVRRLESDPVAIRLQPVYGSSGSFHAQLQQRVFLAANIEYPRRGPVLECAWRHDPSEAPVTVLLGPSRSGKTTLLRCLAGLERPTRGHIRLDAEVWLDAARGIQVPPDRRNVGLLFLDYALFSAHDRGGEHCVRHSLAACRGAASARP